MTIVNKNNSQSQRLKIFLLFVIIIVTGVVISVFAGRRIISNKQEALTSPIQNKAKISISKFHQTATKNGVTQWNLDAESAQLIESGKKVKFKAPSVTFFLKDNKTVHLTANYGILEVDSSDMEITGNILVKNESYLLKTEKLYYSHNKRMIYSNLSVTISGDSLTFTAKSIFLNFDTNKTRLEGDVKGIFSEAFQL
ncbi:MAG: LPS export ABC transporter periplasmic protein LptC [Deltaproteobacteria bacterium]|nr:LPS export ABC transporter periplasmic protein LptC [Deltaproteobacteria bacterium]MBW2010839.1 LPS export ABC transporter periplasmic protein LptC [Deltaproteobacteria bacterium]